MSSARKEIIECPHCHAKSTMNFWDSVNVDLDPELREQIFSDDLFLYHCKHCGAVTGIPYNFIYHDMKNKFMLFFSFFEEDGEEADYDLDILQKNHLGSMEGYTFRKVYGLNQLKEKIQILEQGLNDIAIERQKFCISHLTQPEIAEKEYELYFKEVVEPDEEFPYGRVLYVYNDEEDEKIYTVQFAMDNYYEHCLACKLDPRMEVNGCARVDQKWMNQQMRKE